MSDLICIYHNRDLDGYTSAAIVKQAYPDAKLIGFDYGQELPMHQIPGGTPIIMVDVSLPMDKMLELSRHSGYSLTWIDHHISAINEYNSFVGDGETFCKAILENGISACEGTWKFLYPNIEMPPAVMLLGEYDTWRNQDKDKWENTILPFQFGMRLCCNSPETFPHELFQIDFNSSIEGVPTLQQIIYEGKIVLKYQASVNEVQCNKASFETTFNGLRAICLNGGGFNSDVFRSVYDESKHDIMMPFQFDGNQWTISLYTTKDSVDCSVIAKSHGGGGHKKAAGFQVKHIGTVFPSQFGVKSDT